MFNLDLYFFICPNSTVPNPNGEIESETGWQWRIAKALKDFHGED